MARAAFQVLVLPYRMLDDGTVHYAVFRRHGNSGGYWQGIAGGGEGDETPLAAAQRETEEEAGIPNTRPYYQLDSMCMVPVVNVCGFAWGPNVLVIPEYAFAVSVDEPNLHLSREHTEYRWVCFEEGTKLLHWDSNKSALWELNHRLMARHEALRP